MSETATHWSGCVGQRQRIEGRELVGRKMIKGQEWHGEQWQWRQPMYVGMDHKGNLYHSRMGWLDRLPMAPGALWVEFGKDGKASWRLPRPECNEMCARLGLEHLNG